MGGARRRDFPITSAAPIRLYIRCNHATTIMEEEGAKLFHPQQLAVLKVALVGLSDATALRH